MCMVAGAVTRNYGVLATDSAQYDTVKGGSKFETNKLFLAPKSGFALTFIGTALYFSDSKPNLFNGPFKSVCDFLSEYLIEKRPEVAAKLRDIIPDEDENQPHLCVLLLGMHKGYPTVAQFNSFLDFKPKFLWSDGESPKFSTILYGDDSKPGKAELFKEATEYMEVKAGQYDKLEPGIVAEILTRGIYRKADQEKKLFGKKYAGGPVNAACVMSTGVYPMSGFNVIGG